MSGKWFKGKPGIANPDKPVIIESIDRQKLFGPEHYDAEEALVDAANVALLLDQPLLLTGEPGTGKTQLGEKLALELGLQLFKFETRSTSVAQDLFYTFDHVARFQAAQISKDEAFLSPLRFIEYGALGRAVVQSLDVDNARKLFPQTQLPDWYKGPSRAVVLIDEIDKAPTEFPNDALNEIERHYFRVREILGGLEVKAAPRLRPIVVITSNSEKQLPDAFLRRCVFFHIPPIERGRLERITLAHLSSLHVAAGPLLNSALDLFYQLRSTEFDLRKPPATAEFLAFVAAISKDSDSAPQSPLKGEIARRWMFTLLKSPEDLEAAKQHPLLATRAQ